MRFFRRISSDKCNLAHASLCASAVPEEVVAPKRARALYLLGDTFGPRAYLRAEPAPRGHTPPAATRTPFVSPLALNIAPAGVTAAGCPGSVGAHGRGDPLKKMVWLALVTLGAAIAYWVWRGGHVDRRLRATAPELDQLRPLADIHKDAIYSVAVLADDASAFRSQARSAAEELGPKAAEYLRDYYVDYLEDPEQFGFERCGLGGWLELWQAAIFEIYYELGERALPELDRLVRGDYDWTQVSALETLCRLGQDGVRASTTADLIARRMGAFRYEAAIPAIEALGRLGVSTPAVLGMFDELLARPADDTEVEGLSDLASDPPDFITAVAALAEIDRERARAQAPRLASIMTGKGLEDRSPALDGAVMVADGSDAWRAEWGAEGPPPEDVHRISAALTLFRLTEDTDARSRLEHWRDSHPDPGVREEIASVLDGTS